MDETNDEQIKEILIRNRTVAMVGLSNDPSRPSFDVAEYLESHGFHIIPVNPFVQTVLGEKSYKSLLDIPADIQKTIEIVDIFRRSEDVTPIIGEAIELNRLYGTLKVIWMQLGVINEEAAETARKASLTVIMDHCMMQEHRRLFGDKKS